MRKPRDYDAELEALDHKAKALRQRKISQLGDMVIACGADVLPVDVFAGALLDAVNRDAATQEAWRKAGAAMFQRKARRAEGERPAADCASSSASEGDTLPTDRQSRPG